MNRVLVTGGAGYIGSAVVDLLVERGDHVVVIDDLSGGHREAVHESAIFVEGEIGDSTLVEAVLAEHAIDSVIHFAGRIAVGESVRDPALYLDANVVQSIRLLAALRHRGEDRLVFSSSAAVYGTPTRVPIPEDHPKAPESPYGWTKLAFEDALSFYSAAYGLRSVSLRYFNAAGATARRAERHDPETHLIPNVLVAAQRAASSIRVFGDDYPTPDGTPIRDYIHITDLGSAHLAAIDYLTQGGETAAVNLGNGVGYSVLEVIEAARRVTGVSIPVAIEARRPGDPPALVASSELARELLGWQPEHPDLDEIIRSAWEASRG